MLSAARAMLRQGLAMVIGSQHSLHWGSKGLSERTSRSMTVWPSGLRRWLQAPVRKGVGSNPTAVTCQLNLSAAAASAPRARTCCRCRPAFLHWRALPSRPTGRFGKRGALERAEPCRRHAMFRAHFGVEMFSKNRAHWKSCRDLVSACGRPLV